MSVYTTLARPLIFQFDAESTHNAAIGFCQLMGWAEPIVAPFYRHRNPLLETELCGIRFNNPVGLAAGFDKSGEAVKLLSAFGFGHLEIGSISAELSDGNPAPRLWRLPDDNAIIVHYGLPNDGAETVARRLEMLKLSVPLGINLVKTNKGPDTGVESPDDIIQDYVKSADQLKDRGQYLTLNLSCPNTEDGRDFFSKKLTSFSVLELFRH